MKEQIDEFSDLFRIDGADDRIAKCDDQTGVADISGATDLLLKSCSHDRFGLPEPSAPETCHKDGIEIERDGSTVWTRTFAYGEMVKAMVVEPNLPAMYFDGRGRECSLQAYQAIDGPAEILIEASLAKILGVGPGDQCPEVELRK